MQAAVNRPNVQLPEKIVAMGERGELSPREFEAVQCVAEGLTTKETALVLGCSVRTAKHYIESAMNKLGAINRAHLVCLAFKKGIIVSHESGQITWGMLLVNLLAGIALAFSVLVFDFNGMRNGRKPGGYRPQPTTRANARGRVEWVLE